MKNKPYLITVLLAFIIITEALYIAYLQYQIWQFQKLQQNDFQIPKMENTVSQI
ncbi:MAG: hypothetical protein UR28_C0001G0077 [Candidatus Peregrinibacteria bacterium GW2011_GWF2_33_10]|nr:MAG: hypothetical protein UR28_C0001G0077 [Candidatus Peregrinibacteria bacterium GW2011_GWF2_33_10]